MSALNPESTHAKKDWYPAIGTPIKLTKSFPAKANANAKVPAQITIVYMLNFKIVLIRCEIIIQKIEETIIIRTRLLSKKLDSVSFPSSSNSVDA